LRGAGLRLRGRPPRQRAEDVGGEAAPGVAVAGRVGRADLEAAGRPVGDDARDGVAAGVVVTEDLGEEAPEGRDRAEHPVAIGDAVLVEGVYPSYQPHLEGHGTIPSDSPVGAEETPAWPDAVASDATPRGRSSGGGWSVSTSGPA